MVINAGKDYMAQLEVNKKLKLDELNSNIEELEQKYKLKTQELEEEYSTKAKNLKLEIDREVEEYNYKLKREREINNNKWEDEKLERENVLAKKELEINTMLEQVEAEVERTKMLAAKVDEIPNLLEKEYTKGRKDATTELEREHKYSTELLKKDFQNTIDRQNDKI